MLKRIKKALKILLVTFGVIVLLLFLGLVYVNYALKEIPKDCPEISKDAVAIDSMTTRVDSSWIRHEQKGLWTLYVDGSPYERGIKVGILSKDLILTNM